LPQTLGLQVNATNAPLIISGLILLTNALKKTYL